MFKDFASGAATIHVPTVANDTGGTVDVGSTAVASPPTVVPPQASMARRTMPPGRGDAVRSAPGGTAAPVGESLQQPPLAATDVQQPEASSAPPEEHLDTGAAIRSSDSSTAASTSWARAQASRSAGEWQQQLAKHCSAVAHPHGESMHGNGRERSLATGPLAAPLPGRGPKAGSGSPDATNAHAPSATHRVTWLAVAAIRNGLSDECFMDGHARTRLATPLTHGRRRHPA